MYTSGESARAKVNLINQIEASIKMKSMTILRVCSFSFVFLIHSSILAQVQSDSLRSHDLKDQFSIKLPIDWMVYDQALMYREMTGEKDIPSFFDMAFFLPLKYLKRNTVPTPSQGTMRLSSDIVTKMDTGELPSFFVNRHKAKKGMSCNGFPEKAKKEVIKLLWKDSIFSTKYSKVIVPLQADTTSIGECRALRIKGRAQLPDGNEWVLDVHALSDGKILYLFSLRNEKQYYERNYSLYERAVATVRLTSWE